MWRKETKPKCCEEHEPLPKQVQCFWPEVCEELQKLKCRHVKRFVKRKRLMKLAIPLKSVNRDRFVPTCPCKLEKSIEILRLDERKHTRTEQLAYPKARQLLLFKEQARTLFDPFRNANLNRLIRKSLFSLYSRLANVQPPKRRKVIPKWDRKEWAHHTAKLNKLAKPKKPKKIPKEPSKRMPLKNMKRFKYLAEPRKYEVLEKPEWTITDVMYRYKASERLINLSQPVKFDETKFIRPMPAPIPANVLKAVASARIKSLASPTSRGAKSAPADIKENPFSVSPLAIKYRATKRIKELAEPKEYENNHIRDNPFLISPDALKAKASPRTINLAKPKMFDKVFCISANSGLLLLWFLNSEPKLLEEFSSAIASGEIRVSLLFERAAETLSLLQWLPSWSQCVSEETLEHSIYFSFIFWASNVDAPAAKIDSVRTVEIVNVLLDWSSCVSLHFMVLSRCFDKAGIPDETGGVVNSLSNCSRASITGKAILGKLIGGVEASSAEYVNISATYLLVVPCICNIGEGGRYTENLQNAHFSKYRMQKSKRKCHKR
uniref:Uncharacterized protein n=1 Tax=Glossina austeni TaxID=7395 RepID=A0A1A9UWZ7_GLOAU